MYKNLRIRAYPRCGIVSDKYLPLDSILYYHLVRRTFGEQIISKPNVSNVPDSAKIKLPLKKSGRQDETWFYACSFAQWSCDMIEDSTFKIKQNDFVKFQNYLKKDNKISVSRGKYKAYHIKIYYRHASYIEWYCVGDPYEIANLLKFCTHIGKNSGDGWGEVHKWLIMDWIEDWSIRGNGNKLMRAVPDKNSNFLYGLRPSYWLPKHIFTCKMPD